MDFNSSWSTAESAIARAVADATGTTLGQSLFLGYLPPLFNVVALYTGGTQSEEVLWAPDITSVHMLADVEMRFLDRAKTQETAMRLLRLTPWSNTAGDEPGNVATFRVRSGGFAQPVVQFLQLANEEREVATWFLKIGMEFVFITGGKASVG